MAKRSIYGFQVSPRRRHPPSRWAYAQPDFDPSGFLVLDAAGATDLAAVDRPLTVEAWIFIPLDAVPRNEGIAGYGASWKFGLLANGNLAFTLFGVVDADSGILPAAGTWTHVAAAWEPGVGITFYLDGTFVGFIEETRAMRAPSNAYLGIGSGGTSEPVNASIDRVRIHRALLSDAELDSVAATPKAPLASTLVSLSLNEPAPPYANAGTLQGAAQAGQGFLIANESPAFVSDSPSGLPGDTALVFDGNDRIVVSDPGQIVTFASGDFTVQTWVKFGLQTRTRSVLFANNGPGGALSFSVTQDRRVFVTTYGILDIPSNARIPDDNGWHHIAVIHRQGQDLRFYVDGILGDTIAYDRGLIYTRTDAFFRIGSEAGLHFEGMLDRVQLSDEALDPADLDYLKIPGVDPGAPELEVGVAVSLSWPTVATGFQVESTTDLAPPQTWTPVGVTPMVVGDRNYVLLPTPDAKTFYRLVRPE